MEKIYIGTVTASKGLAGTMVLSDCPPGINKVPEGISVYIGFSEKFAQKFTLKSLKRINKAIIIAMNEITNPETADNYKEQGVFIDKSEIKKQKQNRIDDELIGYKVYNYETKKLIGKIVDIWFLPTQEVWVVSDGEREIPIPAVDEFIKVIDEENRRMKVKLIEGLEQLNG